VVGVVDARGHLPDKVVPGDLSRATYVPLVEGGHQVFAVVPRRKVARVGQIPKPRNVQIRSAAGQRSIVQEGIAHCLLVLLPRHDVLAFLLAQSAQLVEGLGELQDAVLLCHRRRYAESYLLTREAFTAAVCETHQGVLVIAAAVTINPLRNTPAILLIEVVADLIHALLGDAHPVDQQVVRGAQALHRAHDGLSPDLRRWLHQRQEGSLVLAAGVALDCLEEISAVLHLRVLVHQVPALALGEVHQERDEPRVVGAPAHDAVPHRARQTQRRLRKQAQHAGPEVGREEDAGAAVPGLTVDARVQVLPELLLKLGLERLNLLGRLARNNLDDCPLIGAHTVHGSLQILAILLIIQSPLGMRALEYSDQDVLEIATGFRLHVLDQVSLKQALISLTDKSALLEGRADDDADQLVFGGAPAGHGPMQRGGTALGPLHGLKLQDLLVAEGRLRLDVVHQLLLVGLLVEAVDLIIEVLGQGANQGRQRVLVRAYAVHSIPQAADIQLHRHQQQGGHGVLPIVGEHEESAALSLALLLQLLLQGGPVHRLIELRVALDGCGRHGHQDLLQSLDVEERVFAALSPVDRSQAEILLTVAACQHQQSLLVVPAGL